MEVASPGISLEVLRRIHAACELIAVTPGEIGSPRPELGEGIRSYPVPPYVVFFHLAEKRLLVIRVLHERRDLPGSLE